MSLGSPRRHHPAFKFVVEIDGVPFAGFSKVTGLEMDIEPIEFREGGALLARKTPGLVSFPDVTLERGASMDHTLLLWVKTVHEALGDVGLAEPFYQRTLDIVQKDRANGELERWRLFNAWPRNFKPGEWDNSANDLRIESLTLSYEFFEVIPIAALVS